MSEAVRVTPGDPRYCWNPYWHDSHDFAYTLDGGTTGRYLCMGDGEDAAALIGASIQMTGGVPCRTCRGTGFVGGQAPYGGQYRCEETTPLSPGTPVCDGTGVWCGKTVGGVHA